MEKEERIKMSDLEKRVLNANIELQNANKEKLQDIKILISFIKGKIQLKGEVENIINYYESSRKKRGI